LVAPWQAGDEHLVERARRSSLTALSSLRRASQDLSASLDFSRNVKPKLEADAELDPSTWHPHLLEQLARPKVLIH
jgi:hypothetical protein